MDRRGVSFNVADLKAELKAGAEFVQPLPAFPTEVDIGVEDVDQYLTAEVCLSREALNAPLACRLKTQLDDMSRFYRAEINLERDSGFLKESTFESISKHIRRFVGFANKVLAVPLDLRLLGDGVLIAKYLRFLILRKEKLGTKANHSYLETTLYNIDKILKFLIYIQPAKTMGLSKLTAGVNNYARQLHKGSSPPLMNTHELVESGTAIEYDELVAKVHEHAEEVLKNLTLTLEDAKKVQDLLFILTIVQMPSQRMPVYVNLQIVKAREHLLRPEENYISWSEKHQCWTLHINDHKMKSKYNIPPIDIVRGSLLEQVLGHWTSWCEDTIMVEEFGCNADTNGNAFFTPKGQPYSIDSFYSKLKTLIKEICKDEKLNIGPRVLRHLLADSEMYANADFNQRSHVAFLAGHSLATETKVYKSVAPSSQQLSKAAEWCYEQQKSVLQKKRDNIGQGKTHRELKSSQEAEVQQHCSKEKGEGRLVHVTKSPLLDPDEVASMNLKEKRAAFEQLYGVSTESGNQEWLFTKLTGLPREDYKSLAKKRKAASVAFDSDSEFDDDM